MIQIDNERYGAHPEGKPNPEYQKRQSSFKKHFNRRLERDIRKRNGTETLYDKYMEDPAFRVRMYIEDIKMVISEFWWKIKKKILK